MSIINKEFVLTTMCWAGARRITKYGWVGYPGSAIRFNLNGKTEQHVKYLISKLALEYLIRRCLTMEE